ncbi:hypothetical protein BD414DRAFT_268475 [Trametes punicea]|nr:hypothetical protein BD414DRAFT_268475 [Trametes punicea]
MAGLTRMFTGPSTQMAPKRAACQICESAESKYTCAKCSVVYCSVPCYKTHQETCPGKQHPVASSCKSNTSLIAERSNTSSMATTQSTSFATAREKITAQPRPSTPSVEHKEEPLRSLASLKWPYVPEESAFPDPLKRDDPKPLQLHQYEAIATSPAIRRVLATNPRLREILRDIDRLRGEERELALHEALGVGESRGKIFLGRESEEDQNALRELAEAVEAAVRGGKQDVLGLDWGD